MLQIFLEREIFLFVGFLCAHRVFCPLFDLLLLFIVFIQCYYSHEQKTL